MAGKKINLTDQLKKYFGFDTFKGDFKSFFKLAFSFQFRTS